MRILKRYAVDLRAGLIGISVLSSPMGSGIAGPAYPLKTHSGLHYVTDQNGVPFFIQGDSPWYLTEALNGPDVDYYLSNRWVQGYNSIILDIAAETTADGRATEANIYGNMPFTGMIAGPYTNLLSWNVSYFTNVDWVIQRAGYYGICVFAYPLYDDYGGVGWYSQMAGNPTNSLYQYGQFIGNRYKNFTNLVWIGAGDDNEPNAPADCLWNWVAAGIRSADTNHLISAQAARPTPAVYYSAFVTLNSTYPGQFTYIESLANYQHSPVLASFDREPYYEHRNITGTPFNALNCRQFAYWSVFSGDMGHFYGDELQWPFSDGWQAEMWDAGATTITNVIKLMNTRPWWNCVPDTNHTVITGGYGTSGTIDYITCIREATGKTVMAYIPQDDMTPTVAMTNISSSTASAWWYNPSTGAATAIGTYNTSGTQTFTPPDSNDWVLVLDDASQAYAPPGVSTAARTNSLSINPLGGSGLLQLTVSGATSQVYTLQFTTNLNAPWQTLGSGTTDYSGTFSLQVTATSSASFYRSEH